MSEPAIHDQNVRAMKEEQAERLERQRIADERATKALLAPREQNPRVRNVTIPEFRVISVEPAHRIVAAVRSEPVETPAIHVRVAPGAPVEPPVQRVRVAPSVQLRRRESLIEHIPSAGSPTRTVEGAIDRAFALASKDGKDVVVYLDQRVAAVVTVADDGRVRVARLIDDPE